MQVFIKLLSEDKLLLRISNFNFDENTLRTTIQKIRFFCSVQVERIFDDLLILFAKKESCQDLRNTAIEFLTELDKRT